MMEPLLVDDFLISLGLSTATCPQYEYHDIGSFLSVLDDEYSRFITDNTRSQYIVFYQLTVEKFDQDFMYPKSSLLTFDSYYPNLGILLVKIEFEVQSTASRKFGDMVMKRLIPMNSERPVKNLIHIGTAHFRTVDRTKRADDSFMPWQLGTSKDRRWPSLVLEVGFSQSKTGSKKIDTSNDQPLIIRCEELFLRTAGPNEDDIHLNLDDWKNFADILWEVQFEEDFS